MEIAGKAAEIRSDRNIKKGYESLPGNRILF
jgi:hypothetical protein